MSKTIFDAISKSGVFKIAPFQIQGTIYENAEHRYLTVNFYNVEYKFLCIKIQNEDKNNIGIIYLENKDSIAKEDSEEIYGVDTMTILEFMSISIENKEYCVQIMDMYKDGNVYPTLNWIQNKSTCDIPNVANTRCKSLYGLMNLIFKLLKDIYFDGDLYLDDDSKINDISTLVPRLLLGKGSIYQEFGFEPTLESKVAINSLVNDLANKKLNGVKISDLIRLNINDKGFFLPTMQNLIAQILANTETKPLYDKLTSAYLKMKIDISKVKPNCPAINAIGGNTYFHKYIKYKNKYLNAKNSRY